MANSAMNLSDTFLGGEGLDANLVNHIYNGLIARGLSETEAMEILHGMVEDSGLDPYAQEGLLSGVGYDYNPFLDTGMYDEVDRQLDDIAQHVVTGVYNPPERSADQFVADNIKRRLQQAMDSFSNTPAKDRKRTLNEKDEGLFRNWYDMFAQRQGLSPDPDDPEQHYDYRGWWEDATEYDRSNARNTYGAHLSDRYKLPGHETFSDESIYYDPSKPETTGGHWNPDGTFTKGPANPGYAVPYVFDQEDFDNRQFYMESDFGRFSDSPKGARGPWQIMPATEADYVKSTGKSGNIYSQEYAKGVRDWYMDWLYNHPNVTMGNPTEENRRLRQVVAYNGGIGYLGNYLRKLAAQGVDIDNSTDWIEGVKPESRDYGKFIVLHQDTPKRTNETYQDSLSRYLAQNKMARGGNLYRRGGKKGKSAGDIVLNAINNSQQGPRVSSITGAPKDAPLVDEHPGLDLALMYAQPGNILAKAFAPSMAKGMANALITGDTGELLSNIVPGGAQINKVVQPYQIQDLGGGYMLKSLTRGNPLEKQISKNGTVNVNNIRAITNKSSKVDQAVIDKVLSSEEFAGKKAIDYNKFRKSVQDELITYERTPDKRYGTYGMDRLGLDWTNPDIELGQRDVALSRLIRLENKPWYVNEDGLVFERGTNKLIPNREIDEMYPGWIEKYGHPQAEAETYTFSSSRIPRGSDKHYDENTLGHSRTYTTVDEPDVLHVMESQSDWAQDGIAKQLHGKYFDKDGNDVTDLVEKSWTRHNYSGEQWSPAERFFGYDRRVQTFGETAAEQEEFDRLAEEWAKHNRMYPDGFHPDGTLAMEFMPIRNRMKQIAGSQTMGKTRPSIHFEKVPSSAQEVYLSDNFTSRQIQENLRYAAEKGHNKMRYPTRETAAKIEGYPERVSYFDEAGNDITTKGSVYTIGEENEKRLADVRKELKKFSDAYDVYLTPDGGYTYGSRLSDNSMLQLSNAVSKRYASYNSWKASHPQATSTKGLKMAMDMENTLNERIAKRKRIEELIKERNALQSLKPKLRPGVTKRITYDYEDILRKYTEFPKQYQKLFKGSDVRTVTDPKGNTWFEVDVPKGYLKQEWQFGNGGTLLHPYNEFRKGGPKGGIVKKVSDYTSGLLTPEEVSTILRHPTNFSKHLNWDKTKVDSMKMNLYNNKAPYGYDVDSAIKAVTDPSSGRTSDTSMDDNIETARDYMYAEYLGIPENKRRHPEAKNLYEESPYRPTIGDIDDNSYIRFADDELRNKAVDIYNDLILNVEIPGRRRASMKPKRTYLSNHNGNLYSVTPGGSGSNFIVATRDEYDYGNDPYSAVFANYVLGSGLDPNRGQYVSVYDKWDLNPSVGMYKLPNSVIKEFQNIGDASGGFGNPVNYYDRIYLDDYYGIDTTPQGDAYYGGYIPEIKVVGSKDTAKRK